MRMAELLDELTALYEPRLKDRGIQLRVHCADKTPTVLANPGEIRQLLSNLIANGIDALGEAGILSIRVRPWHREDAPFVMVAVADNGSGIEPRNLRRLFEPFFTTKKDVGTGLGLWICEQIAKRHGGSIRVRSRLGRGTVFRVELPALQDQSRAATAGG